MQSLWHRAANGVKTTCSARKASWPARSGGTLWACRLAGLASDMCLSDPAPQRATAQATARRRLLSPPTKSKLVTKTCIFGHRSARNMQYLCHLWQKIGHTIRPHHCAMCETTGRSSHAQKAIAVAHK